MRSLTFAKAAAALALLCTPASAALVNGNFDADPVANGSSTCSGTIGFTGWNSFGFSCGTGLHNPDATQYPGGLAPSGDNVAYHNGNAGFWQAASDIYTAGTTYTFNILVGQRLDETFSGYTLELRAGTGLGPLVASVMNSAGPAPGQFIPASVSFTPGVGSGVLGQNVVVVFRGGSAGTQTSFDNATLTSSVPEPATYALVGSALIALAWRRKRG